MLKKEDQNTKEERKQAKLNWRERMRNMYPNFQAKEWARDSYRMKHPQHS